MCYVLHGGKCMLHLVCGAGAGAHVVSNTEGQHGVHAACGACTRLAFYTGFGIWGWPVDLLRPPDWSHVSYLAHGAGSV